MAKKSHRRPLRYEKDQIGCMWGFISIFDFRHGGLTRKMISDRRRGSLQAIGAGYSSSKLKMLTDFHEEGQGIDDGNESTDGTVDAGKPSVKKLIEEEMFSEPESKQQISSTEINPEGHSRKNSKRTNRSRRKTNDMQLHDSNTSEKLGLEKTISNLSIDAIMEELLSQIQQKNISLSEHDQQGELDAQADQKHFEEKLSEATKVFIYQKFVSREYLKGDGKIHQSKELMDAIQTLISNKELFMELMQDPNSLLVKHIQTLQNTLAEKDEKSKSRAESNFSEGELSDSNTRQSEGNASRKQHKLFRRKVKSLQRKPSKENENSQASNRIVILKPGPAGLQDCETERGLGSLPQSHYSVKNNGIGERGTSHFSFTEIKRKLKHAMGKEKPGISPNGLSSRISSESQNLGSCEKGVGGENIGRNSPIRNLYTEKYPKLPTGVKNGDKTGQAGNCEISMERETDGYSRQRVSNIYIEAKKRLSEMLSNGDEEENISGKQDPKTLGRILSFPEYNFSPICSPGKDWEHDFVTAQMKFSGHGRLSRVNENTLQLKQENNGNHVGPLAQQSETRLCISEGNDDDIVEEALNSHPDISDKHINDDEVEESVCSVVDEMSSEGDVEVVRTIDTREDSNALDSEPSSSPFTRDDQNGDTSEICDARENPESVRLDSFHETQSPSSPLASPPSSPITSKSQHLESAIDRTERPSPISVLDPLFAEDVISPASIISLPAEPPIAPLRIQFEEQDLSDRDQSVNIKTRMDDLESIFEYCETVLQASGMCWDEFYLKSLSSDQLLDLSLFDEVVFFSNQLCHDQKLLFDCINESLVETCQHYFGCSPWVSFVKPNIRPIPDMENSISEVWEGVEWHLTPQLPPHSLEQIVGKDLAKIGKWMDLRFDTESIGAEMGEVILDELMEDAILSCLEENVESEVSAVSTELKEDESSIDM